MFFITCSLHSHLSSALNPSCVLTCSRDMSQLRVTVLSVLFYFPLIRLSKGTSIAVKDTRTQNANFTTATLAGGDVGRAKSSNLVKERLRKPHRGRRYELPLYGSLTVWFLSCIVQLFFKGEFWSAFILVFILVAFLLRQTLLNLSGMLITWAFCLSECYYLDIVNPAIRNLSS